MTTNERHLRVVIAVTESSPVTELWRTAMDMMQDARAEVLALFVHDQRWERAASLPFTREVSKAGSVADFTAQRAQQILAETVSGIQEHIKQLASEADLGIEFRVVAESDDALAQAIVGSGTNVLIAPSFLASRPVYAELSQLDLRIHLVETAHDDPEPSDRPPDDR